MAYNTIIWMKLVFCVVLDAHVCNTKILMLEVYARILFIVGGFIQEFHSWEFYNRLGILVNICFII